jgi:hypothetical protein
MKAVKILQPIGTHRLYEGVTPSPKLEARTIGLLAG